MSRTASMTTATAEALIGPAADLVPNTATRALLRKWLVSRGVVSSVAYGMSLPDLINEYHTVTTGQPVPVQALDTPRPVPADGAAMLAQAIQALMNATAGALNESRVIELIAEHATPGVTVTRLEVTGPAGTAHIDGLVHSLTADVIRIAALAHPIMLVGPAGCGKTTIGGHVATALGLPLYITSTVFDTHELMGFVDGMGNYHSTAFRQAFEHGGVWVADEIDAWDAAALLAANSALANGYASFPDNTAPVVRHANFRMIATANTYGHGADRVYVGRNELDAASLDRFATFTIDYDAQLEVAFCNGNIDWLNRVLAIRANCREKNIRHVVSTRAIIMGTAALAAGISQEMVEALYLFKGMSKTDRDKVGA